MLYCELQVCSVQQDWLDPSLQLQVPLADVDKVYVFLFPDSQLFKFYAFSCVVVDYQFLL